jgi:hypothetical protein
MVITHCFYLHFLFCTLAENLLYVNRKPYAVAICLAFPSPVLVSTTPIYLQQDRFASDWVLTRKPFAKSIAQIPLCLLPLHGWFISAGLRFFVAGPGRSPL